jgi:signal-transduction protein with cAMP-binding, CBS, and nucleotidyltransferase domain|tara:strand:+ start:115423 stop:115998 length:576 start_codon:yes stop_codon:yes gene_type:complete
MDAYKSLHTLPLTEVKRIHQPELPRDLQLSSPASKALLDFDFTAPPLLESNTGIAEALMLLDREHASLKLVINMDEQLKGIITRRDLVSSRLMQVAVATGKVRQDLTVGDVMTPCSTLQGVRHDQVLHANVGRILQTMQHLGQDYLMVIANDGVSLRGLLDARQIARRLQVDYQDRIQARSFADICEALLH